MCTRSNSSSSSSSSHLCVALSVLQQVQQELAGLHGPATLAGGAALVLGLCSAANAASEPVEWDAALASNDILQVALGLLQLHLTQSEGGLTRVLEVNTQVRAASLQAAGRKAAQAPWQQKLSAVLLNTGC